jgi:hypothetical protein
MENEKHGGVLEMLSSEEARFRRMHKIMEIDGLAVPALQMRYIAAGIEHARNMAEHMIAKAPEQVRCVLDGGRGGRIGNELVGQVPVPAGFNNTGKRRQDMQGQHITGGDAIKRTPQVAEQLQRMEKQIARVNDVCVQLESRIGGILGPETPCMATQPQDKKLFVPLAQELERMIDQVAGIASGLDNLLARIEL